MMPLSPFAMPGPGGLACLAAYHGAACPWTAQASV